MGTGRGGGGSSSRVQEGTSHLLTVVFSGSERGSSSTELHEFFVAIKNSGAMHPCRPQDCDCGKRKTRVHECHNALGKGRELLFAVRRKGGGGGKEWKDVFLYRSIGGRFHSSCMGWASLEGEGLKKRGGGGKDADEKPKEPYGGRIFVGPPADNFKTYGEASQNSSCEGQVGFSDPS